MIFMQHTNNKSLYMTFMNSNNKILIAANVRSYEGSF